MDTVSFFVVLFFHLSFLILAFGSVMVTDLYGLLWLINKLNLKRVVKVSGLTELFIWGGWTGMICTGIPLLVMKGTLDSLTTVKLFFVLLIGANGIMLHLVRKGFKPFAESEQVPVLWMFRMGLTITVSQIGWWSAVVIGFLHRHVKTIIEWPGNPYLFSACILAVILAIWGIGEVTTRRMKRLDMETDGENVG